MYKAMLGDYMIHIRKAFDKVSGKGKADLHRSFSSDGAELSSAPESLAPGALPEEDSSESVVKCTSSLKAECTHITRTRSVDDMDEHILARNRLSSFRSSKHFGNHEFHEDSLTCPSPDTQKGDSTVRTRD